MPETFEIPGYRILRELNRGGMAVVYLAEQVALQRNVALKVMNHNLSGPDFKERFLREARLVASFNHPGIVTIHDVGEHEDRLYLSMEVLEGGDLKQRMRESGVTTEQALDILIDLVNALSFAHQKQVVHRDIKPENIMFSASGQVVLTDFGIAKALDNENDDLTREGSAIGTPAYMSPEQFEGDIDFRTDYYSTGIVFFQMLTGERPYRANSLPAYMFKHTSELIPNLPSGLRDLQPLVDGLLAKDRGNRWCSSEAVETFVRQVQSGVFSNPSGNAVGQNPNQAPTSRVELDEDATYIPAPEPDLKSQSTPPVLDEASDAKTDLTPSVAAGIAAVLVFFAVLWFQQQPSDDQVADEEIVVAEPVPDKAESLAIEHASIAVLPFDDVSRTQDQRYFADGLADTLTQVLGGVKDLKVAARAATYSLREDSLPPGEIARRLLVKHLLGGSVQTSGDRVRVIAELVLAESGDQVWSQTFDGNLDDIFAIQDQIAGEVVSAIEGVLLVDANITERYRPVLQAYEQLILGFRQLDIQTAESLQVAEKRFREAIAIDPDYALAYVALADTLHLQDIFVSGNQDSYSGLPSSASRALQRPLIEKALALSPNSGEAHASMARITVNEVLAEQEFKRAIELAPNYAPGYLRYSEFLTYRQGRYQEALDILEIARTLDPVSAPIKYAWIRNIWSVGRAEEALDQLYAAVRSDPDFPPYYKIMARWQLKLGKAGNALKWIRALRELDPDNPAHWGEFAGECFIIESLGMDGYQQCMSAFVEAHPNSQVARRERTLQSGGSAALIDMFKQDVLNEPGNDYRVNQLGFELAALGRFEEAVEAISTGHPELAASEPFVTGQTIWPAMDLVLSYRMLGRDEETKTLLDAAESAVSKMRLIEGPGYTWGNDDALIAASRGDYEEALNRLERAVSNGWRFGSQYLKYQAQFSEVRDRPRFQNLLKTLDDYAAEQRAWYEENRDTPLF